MKAQSLRRALTLSNALLVAGLVGAAGWWFAKARPALGDPAKRAGWVKGANDAYQAAANNARKAEFWQVFEKDLDEIKRPDLSNERRFPTAPGVWPYVGPVPPPPKSPKAPEAPKAEAPKGLAALGRVLTATVAPQGDPYARSVIQFEFSATKRRAHFAVGSPEPLEDRDPKVKPKSAVVSTRPDSPRAPGKYLVDVAWADYDAATLRIVYDEVSADPAVPPQRKEEILGIQLAPGPKEAVVVVAEGQPGENSPVVAGRTPGAGGRSAAPAGAGDPAAPLRIVGVDREGARYFEFDDATWSALSRRDLEREILQDVKSEDVPGENGGVRVTGVATGSVPAQFGIQPGDVLVSVAGQRVRNRNEAIEVAKGLPKETTSVAVVLRRDGVERTVIVDPRDPKTRGAAGRVGFDKR